MQKIHAYVTSLVTKRGWRINPEDLLKEVRACAPDRIGEDELWELCAESAAGWQTKDLQWEKVAACLEVKRLHDRTPDSLAVVARSLYQHKNKATGRHTPLITKELCDFMIKESAALDGALDFSQDFEYSYFGIRTLMRSYLMKAGEEFVERPQHMLMRVACSLHLGDLARIRETHALMAEKWYTHASPTLFNAGSPTPQNSSCFLLQVKEDSIGGIFQTLEQCAHISKSAGGIGLAASKVRAKGTRIASTNGRSNGLVPMLRVFNNAARYVDQGGGKRKGSFAIYLEPWHADVFDFLDLRKNTGVEEHRARDLFYALWIPDLFMERVEADGEWTLMCPHECPGLVESHGAEFRERYEQHELEGRGKRTVRARELWNAILVAQMETGMPYMLYKDACNRKSNHQHLGTLQSSNLCTEIVQYTAPDEVAVCNLASVALPRFVTGLGKAKKERGFDFEKLRQVVGVVTRNLNRVIDVNFYPLPEARRSNLRHRPMGIGVQGLADVFMLLGYPYEGAEAQQLNREIFETLYFAALEASCALAATEGAYPSYEGSPVSQGTLHFDHDKVDVSSSRWGWAELRAKIRRHGLRNSLLVAPMPTASTSQILGNNESFEPYTSNLYVRRTLAGEFVCINKHLAEDLRREGLWSTALKDEIVRARGSVQELAGVSPEMKKLYKTAWEIKQKAVLQQAIDRAPFIDQSQSLNLNLAQQSPKVLSSMHFFAWKGGLKTGMYYLRTKPASDATQVTVKPSVAAADAVVGGGGEAAVPLPRGKPAPNKAAGVSASREKGQTKRRKNNRGLAVVCTEEVCVSCSG